MQALQGWSPSGEGYIKETGSRRQATQVLPDLTVEYLVSSEKWDDLFDETDRNLARLRLKKIQSLTTSSAGRGSQLPRNGLLARGATAASASFDTPRPSDGMDERGGNWDYTRRRTEVKWTAQSKKTPLEEI